MFSAAFYGIYIRVLFEEGYIGFAIYSLILMSIGLLLTLVTYLRTLFIDPGYVNKDE